MPDRKRFFNASVKRTLAVGVLAAFLPTPGAVAVANIYHEHGWMWVPNPVPLAFSWHALVQGGTIWEIDEQHTGVIQNNQGKSFTVVATYHTTYSDFDIHFTRVEGGWEYYKGGYENPGDESGTIPVGANRAYVTLFWVSAGEFDFDIWGDAPPPPQPACSDGLDNDGDGLTDYPSDPGCSSSADTDEFNAPPPAQCNDGVDNDGDGKVDYPADPGCSSSTDNDEFNAPPPECSDGADNDGDGKIDYPADPGCSGAGDTDEWNMPQCDDGVDNDGDGKVDYGIDPGCSSWTDDDEFDATLPQCSDGVDNDADGTVDYPADPGCSSANDENENAPPNAPSVPSGPSSGTPGQTYTYTSTATDPDGHTIQYTFDWGDGSQSTTSFMSSGTGGASSHSWGATGSYCVKVRATDSRGAVGAWSGCLAVAISNQNNPPSACWSYAITGMTLSVDGVCSSDPDGNPLTHSWSWGDGTSDGGNIASHSYANRGNYPVTLTVSDGAASNSLSRTLRVGPTDDQLTQHYAPVFYHDTDNTDYGADEFTEFNFDDDWIGKNNWDNEPIPTRPAYVYTYVVETSTNYHIGYAVFHPRDWADGAGHFEVQGSEHENDMEGVLILVKKDGTSYGGFLALHTVAHADFYTFTDFQESPSNTLGDGQETIDGDINFWTGDGGKHSKIGIEAKGHGIFSQQHPRVWDSSLGDFLGGDGNVYYPTGVADQPGFNSGGPQGNDRSVGYALTPINPIWDRRDDRNDNPGASCVSLDLCPFNSPGTFRGDSSGTCGAQLDTWCDENSANAPWKWNDGDDGPVAEGEMFTAPAHLSGVYLSNLGSYSYSEVYRSAG